MRVTGLGHASALIETAHGSVLTDPWVNPAYFGSWFPFPDNSQLDWDTIGRADYLFVSHLHHDHFDPEHLKRHISKKTTVLLPEFPTSELEDALRDIGFTSFVHPSSGEVVDLDGLRGDDPVADLADRRPDRRLVALVARRRRDAAEPERRAPVRAVGVPRAGPGRRLPHPVLRGHLVPDGVRAAQAGQAGARPHQARTAVRPHAALHRGTRRAVRVPDRGAAVLPRRRALGLQRHLRRRVEHLPRSAGLSRLAARARA